MKNLVLILISSLIFFSCKKEEVNKVSFENKVSSENKVKIDLWLSKEINGTFQIYLGDALDTIVQLSDLEFSDTINSWVFTSIERFYTTQEIKNVDCWIHIAITFTDSIDVFNQNYFNDLMTFSNNNLLLLETSTLENENVINFYNSFWIKLPPTTIKPTLVDS